MKETGKWRFVGPVYAENWGIVSGGAYWSKDGTVIVTDDEGKVTSPFLAYDFLSDRLLRDEKSITLLVKQRGGKDKKLFSGYYDLNPMIRPCLWWELDRIREENTDP